MNFFPPPPLLSRLVEIRYKKSASKAVNRCDFHENRRKLGRTFLMTVNQIAFGHARQEAV
jgi:hypothetical protein